MANKKEEPEVLKNYKDLGFGEDFTELVGSRVLVTNEMAKLQEEKDNIDATIADYLADVGVGGCEVDSTHRIVMQTTPRTAIDRIKLIELGVPVTTIDSSTKTTVSKPFVRLYGYENRKPDGEKAKA